MLKVIRFRFSGFAIPNEDTKKNDTVRSKHLLIIDVNVIVVSILIKNERQPATG
jgi:hypothetical protein